MKIKQQFQRFMLAVTLMAPIISTAADSSELNSPLLVIPKLSFAPVIDGKLNDTVWQQAAVISNFHGVKNGINRTVGSEPTALKIGYTDQGLYLAAKMSDAALLPVNQMRHEFLRRFNDGYLHHQRDDSLSILLVPTNSVNFELKKSLFFAMNGRGYSAIKEAPYYGNYFKFKATWKRPQLTINSKVTTKGYWTLELFMPFKELQQPLPEMGSEWLMNFTRFQPRLHERTHWAAGSGEIDKVPESQATLLNSDFGRIVFGSNHTAIAQISRFKNSDFAKKQLAFAIISDKSQSGEWQLSFRDGDGKIIDSSGDIQLKKGKNSLTANFTTMPQTRKFQYNFALKVAGRLIYNSGWRRQAVESAVATVKLSTTKPLKFYWNNQLLSTATLAQQKLPLINAANIIAIKATNNSTLSLSLTSSGFPIVLDNSWRYSKSAKSGWQQLNFNDTKWQALPIVDNKIQVPNYKGDIFIRKVILNQTTKLFPQFPDNTWQLTRGGTDIVIWSGSGIPAWNFKRPLKDFKLMLDLPQGLALVGVGNVTRCRTSPNGPEILSGRRLEFELVRDRKFNRNGITFQRYVVTLKNPLAISAKLPVNMRDIICAGLRFGIRADAGLKLGSQLPLYISSSAFKNNFTEYPHKINCKILPKLDGGYSSRLNFVMMEPEYLCLLDNQAIKKAYLNTLKNAGINTIFAGMTTDIAKRVGLRQTYFFNFWTDSLKRGYHGLSAVALPEFVKRYPGAIGRSFTGKPAPSICPVYLAKNRNNIWQAVDKSFTTMLKRCPSLTMIFWDFEFPLWSSRGVYTGFSAFGIATFRKTYKIKEPLTPTIIKAKYSQQWRQFMEGIFADICRRLQQLASRHNIKFSTWTGYENHPTEDCGFSLAKNSPYTDIVFCGYGRSRERLLLTQQAVGKKLNCGILASRRITVSAPSVATLTQRTLDSRNGFHLWLEGGIDGAGLTNIATTTKGLTYYDQLITAGTVCKITTVRGIAVENCYAFYDKDKLLIALVNTSGVTKQVKLTIPAKFAQQNLTFKEFYSKQTFRPLNAELSIKIAPGKTRLLAANLNQSDRLKLKKSK